MFYFRIAKRKIYNIDPCVDMWLNNTLFTSYEKAQEWLKAFREKQVKELKERGCLDAETYWTFNREGELVENCYEYVWNYRIEEFEMPQYEII